MDQVKIGKFIAQLRQNSNLTQAQLGEELGVTNKTISRWENGHYAPDIDMLQSLSRKFNVSINEIISGERLPAEKFKAEADKNLISAWEESSFTLSERIKYRKTKWLKDNRAWLIIALLFCIALLVFAAVKREVLLLVWYQVAVFVFYAYFRNRMMIYVENKAFTPDEYEQKTKSS